jgi:hypothetical protein
MVKIIQNVLGERLIMQEVEKLTLRIIPPSKYRRSVCVERVR